jgi:retron-type reverse transcriptase
MVSSEIKLAAYNIGFQSDSLCSWLKPGVINIREYLMKHHFGDLLDRDGDYWTIIPNRDRYAYSIGEIPSGSKEITIVTIGKNDENWERILTPPNLEEVTLHEPNKDQLKKISQLTNVSRLRIAHARPKDIESLSPLINVEELVMEYVSGFSDLSPLRSLKKLKSLHLENLRKVYDFIGLMGIESLRYLRIDGALDWKQPISNFEFLKGLPNLEVLSFGQVINKTEYPAFLPALSLKKLKKIKMSFNMFPAKEYALNKQMLHLAWKGLKKNAAIADEAITVKEYGADLDTNLEALVERLKQKRYRAKLIKRRYIQKQNGRKRPLGIPALEDKIVQKAAAMILTAIYEQDFLECSYGYRLGKGAKDAVSDLVFQLQYGVFGYIVEADVKSYFDNIAHDKLLAMLEKRINDRAFMRLVTKWLKAGVLEPDGYVKHPVIGTPQGGIITPLTQKVTWHFRACH